MAAPRAIVFDLDGTLVDSAHVVGAILNGMRKERSLGDLPVDHFRRLISRGAAEVVAVAMEHTHDEGDVAEFRRRYNACRTEPGHLYPGVADALEALAALDFKLGICSNKPEHLCRKVLEDIGLDGHFGAIVGGDTLPVGKPDPRPLQHTLALLGAEARSALFVGDSTVDERTARAAGVPFVFFTGGYDDGVDRAGCRPVAHMGELIALLDAVAA